MPRTKRAKKGGKGIFTTPIFPPNRTEKKKSINQERGVFKKTKGEEEEETFFIADSGHVLGCGGSSRER